MDNDESKSLREFCGNVAAGILSAIISKTISAPIERVKLILQTQHANSKIRSGKVPAYTGIINCFTGLVGEQGLVSLWRGNGMSIVGSLISQGVYLLFNNFVKTVLPVDTQNHYWSFPVVQMVTVGITGAACLIIVYPIDYARLRLASDVGNSRRHFSGFWDCIKRTVRGPGGLLALYDGFIPSIIGIIVYRGSQLILSNASTAFNPYTREASFVVLTTKFAVAQSTVIVSGLCSYPFDTVRRRMQMESDKPNKQRIYHGVFNTCETILREEGIHGFYKGAHLNILPGITASMLFLLYAQCNSNVSE